VAVLKPFAVARDSGKVKTREPRSVVPACRYGDVINSRGNGRRVSPGGKPPGNLSGGESSEGTIPGVPSARKKADWGLVGVNRQEGNQTLKAERSRSVKPALSGPLILICAVGNQSPREGLIDCGRSARSSWVILRKEKLEERIRLDAERCPANPAEGKPHSRGNGQRQSGSA
jgi:hypothetical protein